MINRPFIERAAMFALVNALVWWALARYLWPWCGPHLLSPCPLLTALGCKAVLVVGALCGLTRAIELEVSARRMRRGAS